MSFLTDEEHKQINRAIHSVLYYDNPEPLTKSVEILRRVYPFFAARSGDWRTGYDTYGYDPDTVLQRLEYISDKWCCAFRIAWLIGLFDPVGEETP